MNACCTCKPLLSCGQAANSCMSANLALMSCRTPGRRESTCHWRSTLRSSCAFGLLVQFCRTRCRLSYPQHFPLLCRWHKLHYKGTCLEHLLTGRRAILNMDSCAAAMHIDSLMAMLPPLSATMSGIDDIASTGIVQKLACQGCKVDICSRCTGHWRVD